MAETALPSPIAIKATVVAPTIRFGAIVALPAALSIKDAVVAPTATLGVVRALPSALSMKATVVAPTLAPGAISLLPSPVSMKATVLAPDFRFSLQTVLTQAIPIAIKRLAPTLTIAVPSATLAEEAVGRGYWYTPGNFFNGSHGVIAGSTYLYGLIHFASIPHTVHSWLTNATLTFDTLVFPFTGTIAVDICTYGEGVPTTAAYPRMGWSEVATFSFTTASSATMNLRRVAAGFGGVLGIPNALQAAWARSNGTDVRSLTFRLRQTAGSDVFMVDRTLVATAISLTTTTSELPQNGVPWDRVDGSWDEAIDDIIVDAKTGVPLSKSQAVKDGYTGTLVHPDNYDPPEPRGLRRRTLMEHRSRGRGQR